MSEDDTAIWAYHGNDKIEFTAHEMRLLQAGEHVRGYRWAYTDSRPAGELVSIEHYVGIIDTRKRYHG